MKMNQIIFVVESNDNVKSDDRYIKRIIECNYDISDNLTKINFVHMDGKSKFNNKKVKDKIKAFAKYNKNNNNYIIYCFDTDRIDIDANEMKVFKDEEEFCKMNSYYFVWFNLDVEDVVLGHQVYRKDKEKESICFYKEKIFISRDRLTCNDYNLRGKSNICLILDQMLEKK